MITYTFSKAERNFATILNKAKEDGEVLIKRKDGTLFKIQSVEKNMSPFDVKGINLSISSVEIVDIIHEIRER